MLSPRVSVVIPTYNRRLRLGRVLDALSGQALDAASFEVVVVDDGSTDGTPESLAAMRTPYVMRSFRQANAGPARARNRGIQEARGELVLFLDDDVMPEPCLLSEHMRSHAQESVALVVMGPLASLPQYAQPWVAWEQAKIERQYRAMLAGEFAPTFRQFWTGNASLHREDLLQVGGFNTAFARGEDVELGARLHKRGLQFRFNPRAVGVHHAERSLQAWSQAQRSYGRLEVEIFGQLGEEDLIHVLAGNFARLPDSVQAVLRRLLLSAPQLGGAAEQALSAWLASPAARAVPGLSSKVCSALANWLYWQASASALGPVRFHRVLEKATRLATVDASAEARRSRGLQS